MQPLFCTTCWGNGDGTLHQSKHSHVCLEWQACGTRPTFLRSPLSLQMKHGSSCCKSTGSDEQPEHGKDADEDVLAIQLKFELLVFTWLMCGLSSSSCLFKLSSVHLSHSCMSRAMQLGWCTVTPLFSYNNPLHHIVCSWISFHIL